MRDTQDFANEFPNEGFADFAMEWQVDPFRDNTLFRDNRAPQLPFEQCRLPTAPRPSRHRKLRGSTKLMFEQAKEACRKTTKSAFDRILCIDDVMTTGLLDLAEDW